MKKKDFLLNILYYVLPMILIIPLSVWGLYQAEQAVYDSFYVKGISMEPTLSGGIFDSTYGRYDSSEMAIDKLERFDLVVCYYPFETSSCDYETPYVRNQSKLKSNATLKVKRVIGLPYDTLLIDNNLFTIFHTVNGEKKAETYGPGNIAVPFERKGEIVDRKAQIILGADEYFVMGDNWSKNGSTDCCNPGNGLAPHCLYKENIAGVIFRLDGLCSYGEKTCNLCGKKYNYDVETCSCGSLIFTSKQLDDIVEKHPYKDGPIYLK